MVEKRFRRLNAPELMKVVYDGRKYEDGIAVRLRKRLPPDVVYTPFDVTSLRRLPLIPVVRLASTGRLLWLNRWVVLIADVLSQKQLLQTLSLTHLRSQTHQSRNGGLAIIPIDIVDVPQTRASDLRPMSIVTKPIGGRRI